MDGVGLELLLAAVGAQAALGMGLGLLLLGVSRIRLLLYYWYGLHWLLYGLFQRRVNNCTTIPVSYLVPLLLPVLHSRLPIRIFPTNNMHNLDPFHHLVTSVSQLALLQQCLDIPT